MSSRHFVIIGNGISGITFARHLRKGDAQALITVISGESPYFFFAHSPDVCVHGADEVGTYAAL